MLLFALQQPGLNHGFRSSVSGLNSLSSASARFSVVASSATALQSSVANNNIDTDKLFKGRIERGMWRPDKQDVERISWGKPAKKKGTGSRGVPHRLNQEERQLFDQARSKGFLEVIGSAWRSQRRDAPLVNTYRSWCDACAHTCIVVHKSSTGVDDAVVMDISTLRFATAADFQATVDACLQTRPEGIVRNQGSEVLERSEENDEDSGVSKDESEESTDQALLFDSNAWETRPIYQLPPYCIAWESLQRPEAKQLAKTLATLCETGDKTREKTSKKPVGVKPGKSRRHGGYGIG